MLYNTSFLSKRRCKSLVKSNLLIPAAAVLLVRGKVKPVVSPHCFHFILFYLIEIHVWFVFSKVKIYMNLKVLQIPQTLPNQSCVFPTDRPGASSLINKWQCSLCQLAECFNKFPLKFLCYYSQSIALGFLDNAHS
jgi:hypothetical protein